jgi:hypothetical protein
MGGDALKWILDKLNIWKGQFYDAEWDMWFDAETHPLSPSYIERERDEGDVGKDR